MSEYGYIRKESEVIISPVSLLLIAIATAHSSLWFRYFSSRPDIFANAGQSDATPERQAVSAVHRAMVANPEATSKVMSAGLRHVANSRTAASGGAGTGTGVSGLPTSLHTHYI